MPFTEHVRELLAGRPPSEDNTALVAQELRRFVRQELRSRGLMSASPELGAFWQPALVGIPEG